MSLYLIFFFPCFCHSQLKALEKAGRVDGSSFVFPLALSSFGSNYFVAEEVSSHKNSLPFSASVVSLGLDVPVLLSDLAAHSSVSCSQAGSGCSCRAPQLSLAAWTLPFPWEYTDLLLGQALLLLLDPCAFLFVCFHPFAIHPARSFLLCVLCCCSEMWWHCGVPFLLLSALPCPGY